MIERALSFGQGDGLCGILHESDPASRLPGVILLNAGLVHRVGPHRMSVDWARRLASLGFPCLRMDLSGLGDSAPRLTQPDPERRALDDVHEAMDFLGQRWGARPFVLAGMCSGAVNAHHVAADDPRVVGAIMLDGYAYPTPQFLVRRYASRLLDPASALSFLGRQVARLLGTPAPPQPTAPEDNGDLLAREFPARERVACELRRMMERNLSLLMVYSGSWYLYFNYRDQIRDSFPEVAFGDRLTVEHFPEADHTYTLLQDRERLFAALLNWMQSRF